MNNLSILLSSNTRAEFFRLLFSPDSKEYYMREIEKETNLSIGTIQQEARKLEELHLINKRKSGNRTYFSANTKNPLFFDIQNLVIKTTGPVDLLTKSLSREDIKLAFIFGSYASGKFKSDSDIDLFIIGDIGLRKLSPLLRETSNKTNREINPHVMDINEFIERLNDNDHFINNIINNPKLFIKGDENEFERLGE